MRVKDKLVRNACSCLSLAVITPGIHHRVLLANNLPGYAEGVIGAAVHAQNLEMGHGLDECGNCAALQLFWVAEAELSVRVRAHHVKLPGECHHGRVLFTA